MTARKKTNLPARRKATDVARKVLVAREILLIYTDGEPNPFERVCEEYGHPRDPATRSKMNASELLTWATGVIMGDAQRIAMSGRVYEEVVKIAFAEVEPKPDQLAALKMLGQELGLFNPRGEALNQTTITHIENVIVSSTHPDR